MESDLRPVKNIYKINYLPFKNTKNCHYFLLVAYYLQIFSYLCNVFLNFSTMRKFEVIFIPYETNK